MTQAISCAGWVREPIPTILSRAACTARTSTRSRDKPSSAPGLRTLRIAYAGSSAAAVRVRRRIRHRHSVPHAAVVLATGNPLPNGVFLPREIRLHPGYIDDPWRCDYRRVGGHVLAIGSGLTALDVLVALDACGHRGVVHVLSRRGRFPNVHADVAPYDVIPALDTRDARALLRSFRLHVRKAAAARL